jgi:hypothetical protein
MDIAVCISGGIKYPEKSLKSLKNIFPNENIKVFIHTWKINDRKTYLKNTKITREEELILYVETEKTEQLKKILYETSYDRLDILKKYNYQDVLIENFDEKAIIFKNLFDSLNFISYERNDIGFISMFYSIYKCNELKIKYENENNMKFDKVIRMRFDSDFMGKKLLVNELVDDLVIPNGPDWEGLNDQFAVGSSESIDYYSNLYNNFASLQHISFQPEKLLKEYMANMEIKRIDFDIAINSQDRVMTKYSEVVEFVTEIL